MTISFPKLTLVEHFDESFDPVARRISADTGYWYKTRAHFYFPGNTGGLLSINALSPSAMSSVLP